MLRDDCQRLGVAVVITKKSILVPEGALDQPLLERSKLDKQHISGREFYQIYFFMQLS